MADSKDKPIISKHILHRALKIQYNTNIGELLKMSGLQSFPCLTYKGYLESKLGLTVNKRREKQLYTKNIYVIQLLLYVVTTRTEAFAVLGNNFLYASVKEACRL
jgi:hypothetical protein